MRINVIGIAFSKFKQVITFLSGVVDFAAVIETRVAPIILAVYTKNAPKTSTCDNGPRHQTLSIRAVRLYHEQQRLSYFENELLRWLLL